VTARPIAAKGLRSGLWAATLPAVTARPYIGEFVSLVREMSVATLTEVDLM